MSCCLRQVQIATALAILAGGAAAATLGACGDQSSRHRPSAADEVAIRTTVRGYWQAVMEADGRAACALMSTALRRNARASRTFGKGMGRDYKGRRGCAQAMTATFEGMSRNARQSFARLRIIRVGVNGPNGRATYGLDGQTRSVQFLHRELGQWRLAPLDGL